MNCCHNHSDNKYVCNKEKGNNNNFTKKIILKMKHFFII